MILKTRCILIDSMTVFLSAVGVTAGFWLASAPPVFAVVPVTKTPSDVQKLDAHERDRLRYQLQLLLNEADLLVQNRRSDRSDVQRQQKESAYLRVYDRIPRTDDLDPLKQELGLTAESRRLDLIHFDMIESTGTAQALPVSIYTDQPGFEIPDDQLVQTFRFRLTVRGKRKNVEEWVRLWGHELVRLVEPEPAFGKPKFTEVVGKKGWWQIQARAYRYRSIQYPRLEPRDPLAILPSWVRHDPQSFARQEPQLWQLVERTRLAAPKAKPIYEEQRQALLERAQFRFFMQKSLASDRANP